jgi:hypothetical protein
MIGFARRINLVPVIEFSGTPNDKVSEAQYQKIEHNS